MTPEEKYIANLKFEVKVRKSKGQEYEDFFSQIMQKVDPDFRKVKPQGSYGDRKNDGFNRRKGIYYQVYAPEDPKTKINQATQKLREDFKGLKKYWKGIKKFHFVFNDKFEGAFPELELELSKLEEENPEIRFSSFLAEQLQREFESLFDEHILSVIGGIPNSEKVAVFLDQVILVEAIGHLLKHQRSHSPGILYAPDFEEKIKFNKLNFSVATFLHNASLQVGLLEEYFNTNPEERTLLKEIFVEFYEKTSKNFQASKDAPNLIFFDILEKASEGCPSKSKNQIEEAILVLMSYYFEACDIYDPPIVEES